MDYSNCDYEFQQGSLETMSMEDTDFSETIKFITQILMEENFDQRPYYDPLSLQITQKSFFDALSPNQHPLHFHNSDEIISSTSSNNNSNSNSSTKPLSTSVSDGFVDLDSSITNLLAQNIFSNADSVSQFKRGFEEAKKFLPPQPQLLTSLESSNFNMVEEKENPFVLNGRKNHEREEEEEGGRNNKQSAFNVVDEDELSEMFDKVLLNLENDYLPHEKPPSTNGAKALPKKRNIKNKTIDLRNLLLLCSQAVYANDNRNANELLKQIRQHSSPFGDASERVAHYFANGLEARLVGDGARAQTFHSSPSTMRITAAEFLKAHQVHFISPPFQKFTYLFSNKMIMKVAKKAEILHIIDFGILYGFQWPMLIKYLSNREGGPPKLRITGIEFPLPGFRPTERIEETGRRLANYCKRFNVPFEYNVIASRNWEAIRVEDLKIESNEVIAVKCMTRFKNLLDESIEVNSPRDEVLHLIRKINPDIFTLSVINGSYNSPFFATRFREALFHFSAIYDMLDTVMPRENELRTMIEREILGREVMNVVACEGLERVERPETYKLWQVRNTKAGFKQLPLD
ncbi:SCARECROW-like protein 14-like, partial [Trifolium pratense]